MPDADDFDVEYFRNLLKGNSPQEGHAAPAGPPAKPAPPGPTKMTRRITKPAVSKDKSPKAPGRKKGGNR